MPLAGAFGHDVDCENSDVRLVCSLARQLGLESLIPSLTDFRDHRREWLEAIRQEHPHIPADEIQRLPNIILCGGTYETWVREVDADLVVNKVSRFGFRLFAEVKAFREQVLQHPRFQWTERERAQLVHDKEGTSGVLLDDEAAVDVVLFMRILQSCENEVLGILHRTFHNHGCIVRSKMFDGLVVEHGPQAVAAGKTLQDIMEMAEAACEAQGWDVHLVEKPLYGLQDYPIPCLEEARAVVEAVYEALGTAATTEEEEEEEGSGSDLSGGISDEGEDGEEVEDDDEVSASSEANGSVDDYSSVSEDES